MRKIKKFEVQLFSSNMRDNNWRTVINNDFFTGDSEAFLVVDVIDQGVQFESAEIILINKDKVDVSRPMEMQLGNTAEYEMEPELIAHAGEWGCQVVFVAGGETFVTPTMFFSVGKTIGYDEPAGVVDTDTIGILKKQAQQIIYDLENLVSGDIADEVYQKYSHLMKGEKGEKGDRGLPGVNGVGIPQTLSITGNRLEISDGNSVVLPVQEIDTSEINILRNQLSELREIVEHLQLERGEIEVVIEDILPEPAPTPPEEEPEPTDPEPSPVLKTNILTQSNIKVGGATNTYVNNVRTSGDAIPLDKAFELRQWEAPWGGMNINDGDLEPTTQYTFVIDVELINAVSEFSLEIGDAFYGGDFYLDGKPITVSPSAGQYNLLTHIPAGARHKVSYVFDTKSGTPSGSFLGVRANNSAKNSIIKYHDVKIYEGQVI